MAWLWVRSVLFSEPPPEGGYAGRVYVVVLWCCGQSFPLTSLALLGHIPVFPDQQVMGS